MTNGSTAALETECCAFTATPLCFTLDIHDSPLAGVDFTIQTTLGLTLSVTTYTDPLQHAIDIAADINGAVTAPDWEATVSGNRVTICSVDTGSSAPTGLNAGIQITESALPLQGTDYTLSGSSGGNSTTATGAYDLGVPPCCVEDKIHNIPPASLNGPFFHRRNAEHALR